LVLARITIAAMFSEWTDPFDINNYYDDIGSLMKDVNTLPSAMSYYGGAPVQAPARAAVELKPEQPTGVMLTLHQATLLRPARRQ
jgi:hypothetical protein